jgi:hypothetical protein
MSSTLGVTFYEFYIKLWSEISILRNMIMPTKIKMKMRNNSLIRSGLIVQPIKCFSYDIPYISDKV